MEGLSFARKYRANSLDTYVGNKEVKDTVRSYLRNGRPQAILVQGNSGCGKTTISRLIEKEYICENRDDETGACGECLNCQLMDEYIKTGRSEGLPDIYEVDASDSSGKRDIDALFSDIEYPAMSGGWKIYLIDEVHLLSEGAMGRLLKILEEPPEMVLMILSTTNPERLLDTIINRCQLKLYVTKPSMSELVGLLQRVCLQEDKEYDIQGLKMIASHADFVIRDALNDLETVLTTRGDAKAEQVGAQFHEVSDKIIFDFYSAYLHKDYVRYAGIMYEIRTKYNFNRFLTSLISFTVRGIYIINSINVEGLSKLELEEYTSLFKKFSPEEIGYILSELKKMSIGDVETNLMTFIYFDKNIKTEESKVLMPKEDIVVQEQQFRNDNLERLERSRLEEGEKYLKSTMQKDVDMFNATGLFNLEKVSGSHEV